MRKTGKNVVSTATLAGIMQAAMQENHGVDVQRILSMFSVLPSKRKHSKEGKVHKVFSRYPERKPTHTKEMARRVRQMQVGIIPVSLVHRNEL